MGKNKSFANITPFFKKTITQSINIKQLLQHNQQHNQQPTRVSRQCVSVALIAKKILDSRRGLLN